MSWVIHKPNTGIDVVELEYADQSRLYGGFHKEEKSALQRAIEIATEEIAQSTRHLARERGRLHELERRFKQL